MSLPFPTKNSRRCVVPDWLAAEAELELRRRQRQRAEDAPRPLFTRYVQSSVPFDLDPWQILLCNRLQKLAGQKGQRILIHAPPQWGKSIIVSQRLPAWLLGVHPAARVRLACYNVTHASKFGAVCRDQMLSAEYQRLFPSPDSRIPKTAGREEWTTAARLALGDAQPSFMALGLLTGFVGQGADYLIIDDPYASPHAALSPAIRSSVWTFWAESAKVRLHDDANVIVMFHRYVQDDIAGQLWEERRPDGSRVWDMWRFAAEADDDPEMPDPMCRQPGERLSPRMSDAYIADQKVNIITWAGQFQGKPTIRGGTFFDTTKFRIEQAPPAPSQIRAAVRYWDIAGAMPGKGDWTVGALWALDVRGDLWILDVVRFQKPSEERDPAIVQQAHLDRQMYGAGKYRVYIEQAPGLAKQATDKLVKDLRGFVVEADPVNRDKVTRAEPYKSQVNAGNIRCVAGPWNKPFFDVHEVFPLGAHDDDVDAGSGGFNKISTKRIPGAPAAGEERPEIATYSEQVPTTLWQPV